MLSVPVYILLASRHTELWVCSLQNIVFAWRKTQLTHNEQRQNFKPPFPFHTTPAKLFELKTLSTQLFLTSTTKHSFFWNVLELKPLILSSLYFFFNALWSQSCENRHVSEVQWIDRTTPICHALVLCDKSAVGLDRIKGLDGTELHYCRMGAFPSIQVSMTWAVHQFPGVFDSDVINGRHRGVSDPPVKDRVWISLETVL